MAIIDKIQLSGTVYTIGNETTTAVTSASTDNEIPTAKAVYDAIPQGGGGKAIEAGTNISITTGETADTINCTLPISGGTGTNALIYNSTINVASGDYSHSEGYISKAEGYASHAEGLSTKSKGFGSHAEGYFTITTNESEHSSGRYNNSVSSSTTFGNSGNTLFSVGNGTSNSARHNAFEIRQNGDIYITKDGQDVKLQDQLGGGGGESCTVDSTTMFYSFGERYSNDSLNMRVRYVVLDYGQDRTEIPNVSVEVNFRDINYNTYVNQNINLDYSTSSYTLGDISQAEYIDVTYDSTIEDFKIAVATAYTSTVFIGYVNFWNKNIKVPFYTISSGSPCTAIENDIPTAISELGNNMLKALKDVNISSQKNAIYIYNDTIDGNGKQKKLKLDEIDGSSSTLKPDIYIGLGTSGWTEINLSEQCNIGSLKATKYRVTYNDSELDSYSMGLQLTVEYAGNEMNDSVVFDETKQPSLQTQDVFSAATLDWNASTKELVITYPETIELYGKQESVNIGQIYSNGCNFGNAITKLESYGEAKQALKPYVKETRAALGGKQDTLVSGTNIKTINGETLLGEGNITIQGGSGGGKAIEAGTNISITTGETADTINCTLPMKAEVNNTSIYFGTDNWGDASGGRNLRMGYNANALGEDNICLSTNSTARGFSSSIIGGRNHEIYNINSFIGGGYMTNLYNKYEASVGGQFNNSVSATTSFGDSGNTLFSVGNGTSNSARHNAFEIRQNGDIYINKDGQDVKLQDQLGGGGSSYTAGDGIDITNDVISVTGKVDTSAITTSVSSSSTDSQVPSAKAVYDIVGNIETLLSKI